ncbi:MAG: VCBS repeat-containing protein, partial [Thermoplasmata archaeon]|nr:VCBS repeat-containing protein [Thermoplasmata archaeon]
MLLLINVVPLLQMVDGPDTTPEVAVGSPANGRETRSSAGGSPLYSLIEGDTDRYGYEVTNLGDVDDDGKDDMVVAFFLDQLNRTAMPTATGNYLEPGREVDEFDEDMRVRIEDVCTEWGRHAKRRLGDVNGDGHADMVSITKSNHGEWEDMGQPTPSDSVDVWYGGPDGIGESPDVSIPYTSQNAGGSWIWFIPSYGGAGDVKGDGYDDLAILDVMDLELYFGSSDGVPTTPNVTTTLQPPASADDRWGRYQIHFIPADFNGDGHSDLSFVRYAWSSPWITVYNGTAEGIDPVPYAIERQMKNYEMGFNLPVDVNGDGYDDAVIDHTSYVGGDHRLDLDIYLGSTQGLSDKASSTTSIWKGSRYFMHDRNILFTDISGDCLDDLIIEHDDPANWSSWRGEMNQYIEYDVHLNMDGSYPSEPTYTFQVPGNFSEYAPCRFRLNDVGDFDGDGFGDAAIGIPSGMVYEWTDDWGMGDRNGYLLIIHGRGVMERISNMAFIGEPILYANHSVGAVTANLGLSEGQGAVTGATLTLDPGGADVELLWNGEVDGNPFSVVSDPLGCVELLSGIDDVETDPSTGEIRPHFKFRPRWEWPHEDPVDVELRIRTTNGELGPLPSPGMFNVVTSLEFNGTPTLEGEWQGQLEEGDWVRAGELVNITNLRVVYAGSGDLEPNCKMAPLVTDDDGDTSEGLYTSKDSWRVSIKMDAETDMDEVLTLSMKDLPGNAIIREDLSIH